MISEDFKNNPFFVKRPEDMMAEESKSLFVDVLAELPEIKSKGHTFIHGPRGSGKSMIFRWLQPDCQLLVKNVENIADLDLFAVRIPLKNTDFTVGEIARLEDRHASSLINAHLLVLYFTAVIMDTFRKLTYDNNAEHVREAKALITDAFFPLLKKSGWNGNGDLGKISKVKGCFNYMYDLSNVLYSDFKNYLRQYSFTTEIFPYQGPLLNYMDFLYPLIKKIVDLAFTPCGPIYLLIDDGDWLSMTQTRVLNSWVATRTSKVACLKISTQYKYKTYYTLTDLLIETPHDYSEVDISTVYTTSYKDKYRKRIIEIVKKRLKLAEINTDPKNFFPCDREQEEKIAKKAEELRRTHSDGKGRGYRASDDAVRYARPEFMRELAGTSKSLHSYSYSGFDQLVHISSGIIRNFIEPASKMYSAASAETGKKNIREIPPSIQNKVIREVSIRFLFDSLENRGDDKHDESPSTDQIDKLSNLIHALGNLFFHVLISDRAERRIFSFAFSDDPNEEIKSIISLGVHLGYFHKSTIGRKERGFSGRTRLYILNRMLAPVFKLDPTGFAGYLFVTSSLVNEAFYKPYSVLRRIRDKGLESELEVKQLSLF